MDVIFNSGNGVARVDDLWFDHAPRTNVLGVIVRLSPAEEMIWSKAFIQERERFDGADIHHLIRCKGTALDWKHLLDRFGEQHWEVLLVHLITFRYSFPSEKPQVPEWVMNELLGRLQRREAEPASTDRVCRGTLLSRQQYLHETNVEGYRDARELETQGWAGDRAYPVKYPDGSGGKDDANRRSG
jgi:hypothetical protein